MNSLLEESVRRPEKSIGKNHHGWREANLNSKVLENAREAKDLTAGF
jgi:hypothetical protein